MGKTRKPYPPEFWQQMVELVRAGRIPELCSKLVVGLIEEGGVSC